MRRWIYFIIALIIGIAAGLIYGWLVSPVQYVDTTPDSLNPDYRADYVLMVAEVYHARQDIALSARQMAILGSEPPAMIAAKSLAYARQIGYSQDDLTLMQDLALALQAWQPSPGGSQP